MSFTELIQLYAPLAGLLGVTFWLGILTERLRQQGLAIVKLQNADAVADAPAVVRMEASVAGLEKAVEGLRRDVAGVQRQLANFIQRGGGKVIELGGDT